MVRRLQVTLFDLQGKAFRPGEVAPEGLQRVDGERAHGPHVAATFFEGQATRKCLPRQGMRRSHGVKEQFGKTTTIVIASTEKEQRVHVVSLCLTDQYADTPQETLQ